MTDRPIIFSGAMVRALLDGRKTQTRRLATSPLRRVERGDRLYVRESIYFWSAAHDCEITFAANGSTRQTGPNTGEIPDAALSGYFRMVDQSREARARISRPSIHMPRWASRLTLIVEDVRLQRLTAIGGHDARCEGMERLADAGDLARLQRPVPRGTDGRRKLRHALGRPTRHGWRALAGQPRDRRAHLPSRAPQHRSSSEGGVITTGQLASCFSIVPAGRFLILGAGKHFETWRADMNSAWRTTGWPSIPSTQAHRIL
jgi:hypothetical protein